MERLDRSAFKKLEGPVAVRWKAIRVSNYAFAKELFDTGHTVNSIAQKLNLSRAMVYTIFEELGLPRLSVSEGNKRSAALMTESQRIARARNAHEAIRKIGRNRIAQSEHSVRQQSTGNYIGMGESELAEKLIAKGFHPIPQAAVEGYNIDLLCDHLAVEVHNYTTRPSDKTQILSRIIKLLCANVSIIYVRTGPHFPVISDAAVNQIVAFYDLTSGNPSSIGKYRVIRGDGQIDWTAERHLYELADIVSAYAALKASS
jgi:uncharacterized protein (UPF0297 family)